MGSILLCLERRLGELSDGACVMCVCSGRGLSGGLISDVMANGWIADGWLIVVILLPLMQKSLDGTVFLRVDNSR